MSKTIKVRIGGKEFSLTGENEKMILSAAGEVDSQIQELKKLHEEEPLQTLSILAALNLAESKNINRRQYETDIHFISEELSKMAEFIKSNLK